MLAFTSLLVWETWPLRCVPTGRHHRWIGILAADRINPKDGSLNQLLTSLKGVQTWTGIASLSNTLQIISFIGLHFYFL